MMGEDPSRRQSEVAALRLGLDLGMNRASQPQHIRVNRAALDIQLTDGDLDELDHAFPPPAAKIPLETL